MNCKEDPNLEKRALIEILAHKKKQKGGKWDGDYAQAKEKRNARNHRKR